MEKKYCQPRMPKPAKIYFRNEGEMKTFSGKRKLRELIVSELALKGLLKEFPQAEGKLYPNGMWGK